MNAVSGHHRDELLGWGNGKSSRAGKEILDGPLVPSVPSWSQAVRTLSVGLILVKATQP